MTKMNSVISSVVATVAEWVRIREENGLDLCGPTSADVDHSALLVRMLQDRTIYEEAPPRSYSYPWYSIEDGEWQGPFDSLSNSDETEDIYLSNQSMWISTGWNEERLLLRCATQKESNYEMEKREDGWYIRRHNYAKIRV